MNESLSNEAQPQEICPHHEWIQQTKEQTLWYDRQLMSAAGHHPATDEPAFPVPTRLWSDCKYTRAIICWQWVRERSWACQYTRPDKKGGIIELLRAGRAAQSSQHAESRTFNPPKHYTVITVTLQRLRARKIKILC